MCTIQKISLDYAQIDFHLYCFEFLNKWSNWHKHLKVEFIFNLLIRKIKIKS